MSTPSTTSTPSVYRTALVTGASRGIGAAICRRLASLGLTVHALARDADALKRLCDDTGAHPHVADVTDRERLEAILGMVEVDVLVNNAGYVAGVGPLHELSAEAVDRMIDINLKAPLHLMRMAVPGMIRRGHGHIVNIGSTTGSYVFAGTVPYASAKAAMSAANRGMRYDLAGTGVRVTEISPGRVATDIYKTAFANDPEKLSGMYREVRTVRPEDVAEAVTCALAMPEGVDVSFLEIVPTDQAPGGHVYAKRSS